MAKTINAKKIHKNGIVSLLTQLIAVLVSFISGTIVPKFSTSISTRVGKLLNVGNVGVLHFGSLDELALFSL